jgi:hypothetical protein
MVRNGSGADSQSPRIVPLALISPEQFANLNRTTGRFQLLITNMMGFFIESVDSQGTVTGVIVRDTGTLKAGSVPDPINALIRTVVLIR